MTSKQIIFLMAIVSASANSVAQTLQMGQRLFMISVESRQGVSRESLPATAKQYLTPWNKSRRGVNVHLVRADRGNDKPTGYFLVGNILAAKDRMSLPENPMTADTLAIFAKVYTLGGYAEYALIGAEQFKSLPAVDILGIHYVSVKQEKAEEFEKFVQEKLNPTVGHLFPDLQLIYYKILPPGEGAQYLLIFALQTSAARDKYWPGGKDSQVLEDTFKPLKPLAKELSGFLSEGSFLEGDFAAAYFESRRWTDFVVEGSSH